MVEAGCGQDVHLSSMVVRAVPGSIGGGICILQDDHIAGEDYFCDIMFLVGFCFQECQGVEKIAVAGLRKVTLQTYLSTYHSVLLKVYM